MTFGFDYGQGSNDQGPLRSWYAPVIIMRYKWNERIRLAVRGEYFADPKNAIVSYNYPFKVMGLSTNLDVQINKEAQWRSEIKWYGADEKIFGGDKNNLAFTTAITLKL